ncbi:MAG: hypothetical protein CEO12_635 [Parcubacteria group bacterium Gr01-1014_46]|nr:MAG: hypothetical protein CEO12_635 [Parcubacteria group bacterium Gr01-1014_46]
MNDKIKTEALEFMMSQKGGVVSTLSGDQPESAFVFYDADENFSIYFPTVITSRKHQNIKINNKVSFTISSVKPPRTIQMNGIAEEVTDKDVTENALGNYIDIATDEMRNKAPITKLNWKDGVVLYRVKPTWLKWSDYSDAKEESVIIIDDKS